MVERPATGDGDTRRAATATRDEVVAILDAVKDPEVPVLSIVELGIVRDVEIEGGDVTVVVTPTYSGCPAMRAIEDDIRAALAEKGIERVNLRTVYAPAWTTQWMSSAAREKLRSYGIAPPGRTGAESGAATAASPVLVALERRRDPVPCPFCGSTDTRLTSEFGATACKALHFCNACTQPFEELKAI
jgi:ring-1,2-phenylacetyl-CoA epoxidase subunit PaaD